MKSGRNVIEMIAVVEVDVMDMVGDIRTDEEHAEGPWVQGWVVLEVNDLSNEICGSVEMDLLLLALEIGIGSQCLSVDLAILLLGH